MFSGWKGVAVCVAWATTTSAWAAETLTADELAHCAGQVQRLRTESPLLLERNARAEKERQRIDDARQDLEASVANAAGGELASGLAAHDRRARLNADAQVLNAQVAQLRGDIARINAVKRDYETRCAQRSFRSADLAQLPADAQAAMRAGLDDVQVPFIED